MKNHLTKREKAFLDAYLEGKPLYECAKVYGSKCTNNHSLSQRGCDILKTLDVSFKEICDLSGLTDEYISRKLRFGCDAKKVIVATWQGKITDEKFYEDPPTQAKYLEMLGKSRGLFTDKIDFSIKDAGSLEIQVNPAKNAKSKDLEL